MQISLQSGNYKIIDSGQAFLFGDSNELKMNVRGDSGFVLSIYLTFANDDTNEQKINSEIRENDIILSCVNFKENGTGLYQPIHVATIDGKELWFIFWSYLDGSSGKKIRSVKYTFFVNDNLKEDTGE